VVVERDQEPILQTQGLTFAYGRRLVIEGVDFDLNEGELLGVLGPNGSGKSTLIGLLCGLLRPKRGRVWLRGKDLAAYRRGEVALNLGVVPQALELAPGFSVLETVLAGRFAAMGRRLFENSQDIDAAKKALAQTGLLALADRPAGELSGGERQRLALARALAAEPGLLLLDEPTSNLDLDHQLRVMSRLEEACASKDLAVCLVSHDLNLAALFCDRLLLLSQGRVLAQGRPEEVLRPEYLAQAYGIETIVDQEPVRHRPRITLIPPSGLSRL